MAVERSGHFQSLEEAAMTKLWKNVLGLWVIGVGIAMSAPALAVTSAVGPYYATPSWDQTLPAATRFIVLTNLGSAAVLDRETGLVWEQSPSTTGDNPISGMTWYNQSFHCINLNTGGRTGWRLPTIQELLSLVDRSQSNPALPSGHPFSNVQSSVYWSATTAAIDATFAITVDFFDGSAGPGGRDGNNGLAWCVRGGPGVDAQ
jgi:hypothetical protein